MLLNVALKRGVAAHVRIEIDARINCKDHNCALYNFCERSKEFGPILRKMSLDTLIDKIYATPEAKEILGIVIEHGSFCSSFVEFGSRGGVSALALFKALTTTPREFAPRFVAVDLVNDDSIKALKTLSENSGISFHFSQGHTRHYPPHETDGFLWDTFHAGGNLLVDLERMAPWIQKCIFILGTKMNGAASEAVTRKLDITTVAKELMISEEGAAQGLSAAIREFLEKNKDWTQVREHGELTVLKRIAPPLKKLFNKEPGDPKI